VSHPQADTYLNTALGAAAEAVELQRSYFDSVEASYKAPQDIVTRADVESERIIRSYVADRHPDHGFVGEEEGGSDEAENTWIVDPIDGTTNFYHGVPHYAVSIALKRAGDLHAGVVHHVPTDTVYAALRGDGAYCDGRRISVSEEPDLQRSLFCTGFVPGRAVDDLTLDALRNIVSRTHGIRRLGTAATALSFVAQGRFEGYYHADLHRWDIAAGALLVTEAGGTVTRIDANADSREHVIASNGPVHDSLSELVRESFGGDMERDR